MIAPCTKGQAFARGLCWDEVHFKPTGVFLNRPGETWTYFENGALVSDFIKASHVYLREEARFVGNFASTSLFRNAGVTRLNEWLFSFLQPRADGSMPPPGKVQGEYAFLPEDIGIAAPNDARSLEVARVNDATFRLQSSVLFTDPDGSTDVRQWPLEGTIEVCGAALRIAAMTQGDIAKACNDEPYNDGGDLRFKIPNGIMRLRLAIAPIPSEMKPYQVSYHLEFPEFE